MVNVAIHRVLFFSGAAVLSHQLIDQVHAVHGSGIVLRNLFGSRHQTIVQTLSEGTVTVAPLAMSIGPALIAFELVVMV